MNGNGPKRRTSDRTAAVTWQDEVESIKRRLQYLDGNGLDPGGGAIGRRKRDIQKLREDMTALQHFDDRMKWMFVLIAIAIAGSWGGLAGAIKIVKAISEAVR